VYQPQNRCLGSRTRYVAQRALSVLKMIIREMTRRRLIAHNPAAPAQIKAKAREKKRLEIGRDVPSKAEIAAMIEHMLPRWRPWLRTAVFTGMRISELLGLTWDCVDFDKNIIQVRQRADRWCNLGPPKSEAGTRDIPMSEGLADTLKRWRFTCPRPPEGRPQLVFPNDSGAVMRATNLDLDYFRALQVRLGIVNAAGGARYGFHKLRHFFASQAIEQNFAPKRLQEILGHSSITMTYDRYGHWFPTPQDDQARLSAAERALFGPGGVK
jgi:integrase